jgi:hypothetical protein
MTKSLIQLSKGLLSKFYDINGKQVEGLIVPPCDFEAERTALSNLAAGDFFTSSSGASCISYQYDQKLYLAISIHLCEKSVEYLERDSKDEIRSFIPPDSHYLYLADRLSLSSIINDSYWVDEYIAGPAKEDGVELEVLKNSLTPVSIFELSLNASDLGGLPHSYIADYICTYETSLRLTTHLKPESVDIIRELFLREKMYFFGQNLFHALRASNLFHSFLEVYRLFEFTFTLPRAEDLVNELKAKGVIVDLAIVDFAKHCSAKLGWRMIERESIKRIFRDNAADELAIFRELVANCKPFSVITSVSNSNIDIVAINSFAEKVADKYYAIRNQVVHQLWPDDEEIYDHDDWHALILFSLKSVRRLYEKHLTRESPERADLGFQEAD